MAKQELGLPRFFGLVFATSFFALSCQSSPKQTETPKAEGPKVETFQAKANDTSAPVFDVTFSAKKSVDGSIVFVGLHPLTQIDPSTLRSEERRVGKE